VIGVSAKKHEEEIIAAYASAGIECLVLWEHEVLQDWEKTRLRVEEWITKAVKDINESPVLRKPTKVKVDSRKGTLVCPYGSGRVFRDESALDRWLVSEKNYWRPGLEEGIDYVVCSECGERCQKLTEHLRKSHEMTKEEYLSKYPGGQLVAVKTSESIAKQNRGKEKSYTQRTMYRCPDGRIVKKVDAWRKAWGGQDGPVDTILDAAEVELPDDGKVVCSLCGYRGHNLTRHLRDKHGIEPEDYEGEVKSESCKVNFSNGANAVWDMRGRKEVRDKSENKTHKVNGLDEEVLRKLYVGEGLSDIKIGARYGMTGEGVAYRRKKFGIASRDR